MRRPTPRTAAAPGGFTAIPRRTLDALLCIPLTRRELTVLLLVARLTYGCRNLRWANLSQADLAAVGIGANHAGEVLRALIGRGLLERDGTGTRYRMGETAHASAGQGAGRERRLEALVARHLRPPPHNGNTMVPETGGQRFPERERSPSQNGNASSDSTWRFDRSRRGFVREGGAP